MHGYHLIYANDSKPILVLIKKLFGVQPNGVFSGGSCCRRMMRVDDILLSFPPRLSSETLKKNQFQIARYDGEAHFCVGQIAQSRLVLPGLGLVSVLYLYFIFRKRVGVKAKLERDVNMDDNKIIKKSEIFSFVISGRLFEAISVYFECVLIDLILYSRHPYLLISSQKCQVVFTFQLLQLGYFYLCLYCSTATLFSNPIFVKRMFSPSYSRIHTNIHEFYAALLSSKLE